jgi:Kdo2-lipid IVA lauroyltransferase/acyltransferase
LGKNVHEEQLNFFVTAEYEKPMSFRSLLATFLIHLIGALPFKVARTLGGWIGTIAFAQNGRAAKITRENLTICYPKLNAHDRELMVKRSLQETAKTAAETCVIWCGRRSIHKYVNAIEGENTVYEALLKNKGLIVLAPHLGNWETLGVFLPNYAKVVNMYEPPKLQSLDSLIRKGREKTGSILVPTNSKGVAALLKHLKENGICGILPDQNPNDASGGAFAPFFGEPAFTMVLAHKLLLRTGAKAVMAFAKRTPLGFTLIFRAPPEEIYHPDTAISLTALNQAIEELVAEAPEQYQWEYKRFRVQPSESVLKRYTRIND